MSHKATNWLADIDPKRMGNGAFRVLFHLCDCHNPSEGCFPSQAYLAENAGMSRSGVNVVLRDLEAEGLISRHQSVDQKTRRQRPTRYMLGFEKGFRPKADPSPKTGHGNLPKPCPENGHGAVSKKPPEPCPVFGQSRVHPAGHKPVIEPVRETARVGAISENPDVMACARITLERFRKFDRAAYFTVAAPEVQDHIIASGWLTDQEREALGLAETGGA